MVMWKRTMKAAEGNCSVTEGDYITHCKGGREGREIRTFKPNMQLAKQFPEAI